MGRDLLRAGLVALALLSVLPAYARVFESDAWRTPALAAGGVALLIAVLVRGLGGGAVLSALVSVVGFVALAPVLAGIVPTPGLPDGEIRAAVVSRLGDGFLELQATPAPAPLLPGIALFLVIGFWVVGHTTHELLTRWSRTGAALIMLTVLWVVPLVIPAPGGPSVGRTVPFLAVAALVLLATSPHRRPTPVAISAGVGMAAVAIAVATPAAGLLPGVDGSAWLSLGTAGGEPRGYQPIVDVSNRLQQPDEREVLRVRSSQRSYLRLAGLDTFDGFTWRLGPDSDGSYRPDPANLHPATDPLPPETPTAQTESVFVDVLVRELANIYVPAPYQPVRVLGPFRDQMIWSTEGGFLATWDTEDGELADGPRVGVREGVTYRIQAERPVPARQDLLDTQIDDERLARYTQLPRDYPELAAQAQRIYEDAEATTWVDRALALQDWFTGPDGNFVYDLDVPALRGDGAIRQFVLDDRRGYCEYFATSMAVMLRATGIPARVATGFLPGEEVTPATGDENDGARADGQLREYSVTTADAHAWVEVLFPGHGWIMFEPTPRSDGAQMQPRADQLAPLETEAERRLRALEEQSSDQDIIEDDLLLEESPDLEEPIEEDTDDAGDAGQGDRATASLAVTLLVLGIVVLLGIVWFRARRRDAVPGDAGAARRILAAQARLHRAATRYGVPRRDHETGVELARRWEREQRVGPEVMRFAELAQRAAFGGAVDAGMAAEAERLAASLIADLKASVPAHDRHLTRFRGVGKALRQRQRDTVDAGRTD